MKSRKHLYYFEGDILCFGKVVASVYRACTRAVSEAQALRNIAAQYKRENGLCYTAKCTAEGNLFKRE